MTDINNRADIEHLVRSFYERVSQDEVIGHFFKETNFEEHLPRMFDFWESIVFGTGKFTGNPMQKHFRINQQTRITPEHFNHWVAVWTETVKSLFEGPKAMEIIQRAGSIASLMDYKIRMTN